MKGRVLKHALYRADQRSPAPLRTGRPAAARPAGRIFGRPIEKNSRLLPRLLLPRGEEKHETRLIIAGGAAAYLTQGQRGRYRRRLSGRGSSRVGGNTQKPGTRVDPHIEAGRLTESAGGSETAGPLGTVKSTYEYVLRESEQSRIC